MLAVNECYGKTSILPTAVLLLLMNPSRNGLLHARTKCHNNLRFKMGRRRVRVCYGMELLFEHVCKLFL